MASLGMAGLALPAWDELNFTVQDRWQRTADELNNAERQEAGYDT